MMPSRGYLLCCIERTGSNLLTQALTGTGMAGRPLEYFNPAEQETPWMREILGASPMVEGLPAKMPVKPWLASEGPTPPRAWPTALALRI